MTRNALFASAALLKIMVKNPAILFLALLACSAPHVTAQVSVLSTISTVVGTGTQCAATTATCGDGASALAANLFRPYNLVIDRSGNLIVADTFDNRIRKVDAVTGVITTVAGNGTPCSSAAAACGDGGSATSANLKQPQGVAIDLSGNIFIPDYSDNRIRKVDATTGFISTVAGTGATCATATSACGDGAAATAALLRNPYGLTVDLVGNIYIADLSDNKIRKVDVSTGLISTVAGSGTACATTTSACGDGGAATGANLNSPTGVAVDRSGNIYIADYSDHRIRKVDVSTGLISTVAGTGAAGFSGDGGAATSATMNLPSGLTVDLAGNIYVADYSNNRIRKIDAATGYISTIVGTGTSCSATPTAACGDGGAATSASISNPYTVAVDTNGDLYVPDRLAQRIRKVTQSTVFARVAVGASATQNVLFTVGGDTNLSALAVPVSLGGKQEFTVGTLTGCTVDSSGATTTTSGTVCTLPVTFTPAYPGTRATPLLVSKLASGSATTYAVGLSGSATGPQVAFTPGTLSTVAGTGTACVAVTGACGDGAAATSAALNAPDGSAVDASGNLYVADAAQHKVRKIAAGTGVITTVAGSGAAAYSGDGGAATSAGLSAPYAVAVDSARNVYIADSADHRIRKIDASTGFISTVAGTGTACASATGSCGDGGAATSAALNTPYGVAVDSRGNLYIADSGDHRVRKLWVGSGIITTIAGTGTASFSGDGSSATKATLVTPVGIAVDGLGNVFVTDATNHRVRRIDAYTGAISTVAGTGSAGSAGDGGLATNAGLNAPTGVAVDPAGDLYLVEQSGGRVRQIAAATGLISTIAGTGTAGSAGDGGGATTGTLSAPTGLALDGTGSLYIADTGNRTLRKIDVTSGALNFATPTTIGMTDTADGPQAATFLNIGTDALTLAVPAAGTNPSVSSGLSWSTSSTCPQLSTVSSSSTLPAGSSCTMTVDFIPVTSGPVTASLVVTDDALHVAGSTQSVSVKATGLAVVTAGDLTTTAVSLSSSGIAFGQSVTLTAKVMPATSKSFPTGTVTFTDTVGTTVLSVGSQTLSAGSVSLSYTPTSAGTHLITATYTSSDNTLFQSSSDNVGQSLNVNAIASTITVAATAATYGASTTTLSAGIAFAGTVAPTGSVTFAVDAGTAVTASCTTSGTTRSCTASYPTGALPVGPHTITVQQAANVNYLVSSGIGMLTVGTATPTVTVTALTINVGSSPAALTANVSYAGSAAPTGALTFTVNGGTSVTAICTGSATPLVCTANYLTSTLVSGNYTIVASLAADANYKAATGSGTLTATAQDFGFTYSGPLYLSVVGGNSIIISYALSPVGSIYPATVTFSVGGLPASATYTITPTTVASGDGAKTVTLTIQTARTLADNRGGPWMRNASWVFAAMLLPLCLRRKLRGTTLQRLTLVIVMLGSLGAMVSITGCGNNGNPAKGASYSVVLTATSGGVQKRNGLTLNIQ